MSTSLVTADAAAPPRAVSRRFRTLASRTVRAAVDVAGPRLFGTIPRVETSEPVAALTFDDGPHPEFTPRLLDLLDRHGVRATFFVIGRRAEARPDLVEREIRSGHAVGNHTWDHPRLWTLTSAARRAQVRACERLLAPLRAAHAPGPALLAGHRLFRPPFGGQTFPSRVDLWRTGHQVITWSLDVQDWQSPNPAWMVERLEHEMRPGTIVLMHDAVWDRGPVEADRRPTLAAVDALLNRLRDRYRFVTVPHLLRLGRPVRVNWFEPWYW